jgi:hypothetical protein
VRWCVGRDPQVARLLVRTTYGTGDTLPNLLWD